MWHDFLIGAGVCFVGAILFGIALKFRWQEAIYENTGEPIPPEDGVVYCCLGGLFCLFMALFTAYIPGAPQAVGAVGNFYNHAEFLVSRTVSGIIILYLSAILLGTVLYGCYRAIDDARTDGKGPVLLAAFFLLAAFLAFAVYTFPQPLQHFSHTLSFRTLLQGAGRVWSGYWKPTRDTGGMLAALFASETSSF